MVMKKGEKPEPILDPKPKPKEPVLEYPVFPAVRSMKKSVRKVTVEAGEVREKTIRSARITTGRNGRIRCQELQKRLGNNSSKVRLTETGMLELSDDLADSSKAKYTVVPLVNGTFKLVSVSMPSVTEPGKIDDIAQKRVLTEDSIVAAVKVSEIKVSEIAI